MEAVVIFYGHFVYFTPVWYILWLFGISYQEKSGNPVQRSTSVEKNFGHKINFLYIGNGGISRGTVHVISLI
jgi:hypothetical protein